MQRFTYEVDPNQQTSYILRNNLLILDKSERGLSKEILETIQSQNKSHNAQRKLMADDVVIFSSKFDRGILMQTW